MPPRNATTLATTKSKPDPLDRSTRTINMGKFICIGAAVVVTILASYWTLRSDPETQFGTAPDYVADPATTPLGRGEPEFDPSLDVPDDSNDGREERGEVAPPPAPSDASPQDHVSVERNDRDAVVGDLEAMSELLGVEFELIRDDIDWSASGILGEGQLSVIADRDQVRVTSKVNGMPGTRFVDLSRADHPEFFAIRDHVTALRNDPTFEDERHEREWKALELFDQLKRE